MRNHLRGIGGAEDGAAGDEDVGAGARAELGGARIDAAVHLNVQVWIPRAEGGDFVTHRGVELLTTEPGFDGQAQDHVDETGVDELVHAAVFVARRGRFARHGGAHAERSNGFAELLCGGTADNFDMERHARRTGGGERGNERRRIAHAQVTIEERVARADAFRQIRHHGRTDGQIRDEMSVHDVDVQPISAFVEHAVDFGG